MTDHKILWVDDEKDVLESAERLFRSRSWGFTGSSSAQEAYELLARDSYAVVVADQRMGSTTGVALLEYAKVHSPATTRIMLTGLLDSGLLEEAVNRAAVFRFISKPWDADELLIDIGKALEHHENRITQQNLLKEVSRQNKRLEELTSGLEQLVAERTLTAEHSKNEVEGKLARMRELVKFIKELANMASVDELILLIKRELKRFHELRSPVLGYLTPERKPMVLYFQGKQVLEKEARQIWPHSVRLRINELDDRVYLANEFGRPFAKVLAIPLRRRAASADTESEAPATLFFEHTLPDERVEEFLGFVSERLQPVSIALDRILLEYQLKYASLQWESTFDGIKDPIAIIDIDYSVVRANRHFVNRSYERRCHKLFAASDAICRGCPVHRALATGTPQSGQIKRSGRIFEVHSYPIRLQNDAVSTNVINHYVDVTAARELYSRVIQNEKMAAIGLLAGNIAHELNNPLTGLRSLAQVLIRELDPELTEVRADLIEVERAAERSQLIIENLLEFSKGGVENKQVVVPLNEIINRTLPMLKTAMRDHRSEIYLTEEATPVRVEPHLLQQVVFNLVNNACQAMRDPGTMTIETEVVSEGEGRWVELQVRDTGEGIPSEIMENIFEPFFTTKDEGQGTGLGLSMSRSIIEKFGGEIRVESAVGKGAKFIVRLPVVADSTERDL